jgi:hypothetical protein
MRREKQNWAWAICPACAREVPVRTDGRLRQHRTLPWSAAPVCTMSGHSAGGTPSPHTTT